jgi:DegV family protein with EDD domain
VRIVTNPGSDVSERVIERYGIVMTPQQIVVDGTAHDTREAIPHATIDEWVRAARDFPHSVGTTASEFVTLLSEQLREDPDIVVITTSRKIIQTHAAALAAIRVLQGRGGPERRISVVDSGVTDVGPGLVTIAAAELARAGHGVTKVLQALELLTSRIQFGLVPKRLDNLVRGGRAGRVRAYLAN